MELPKAQLLFETNRVTNKCDSLIRTPVGATAISVDMHYFN